MNQNINPDHTKWITTYKDIPPYDQLPREIPKHFHLRQLTVLLAGMLGMIVVVNLLAIGFLSQYTTNFGYFLNYQKWDLLKRMDKPVQWLILGDSSVNQGIIHQL
jgi:hypothetical protein